MRKQGIPKHQHYLPVVYLKQFSVDGSTACRTSLIWRLSGASHKEVSVESQCQKPFFYSKSDAVGAEHLFENFEGRYGEVAKLIWNGQQNRSSADYFGLILFIIDVHLRNPAYKVLQQGISRIEIYKLLEQQFAHHVLMRGSDRVPTQEELLEILKMNWRVKLISAPAGELLITSDNPSLFYSTNETSDVHFMVLPVTPECCAIAFDCSVVDVQGNLLTASDVRILNQGQQKTMLKTLYSSVPFPNEDKDAAQAFLQTHQTPNGYIDATDWQMNVLRYPGSLSFVKTDDSCDHLA